MSTSRLRRALLPLALFLAAGTLAQSACANSNPDANLYRDYTFSQAFDQASYVICGSVPGSGGCYSFGSATGFGRIGAIMEGDPVVSGTDTVTRELYVVDQVAGGGASTKVNLVVYQLQIVISAGYASSTLTKTNTIALPLTGGRHVHTFMAANAGDLFIGTDQGGSAVRVAKGSLAVTTVAGFTPSINVSSITADAYGFVDVTFGSLNGSDGVHAYAPTGASLGLSRGASFKLGTGQGLSTTDVLAHQGAGAPALVTYRPQASIPASGNLNPDGGLSTDFSYDPSFKTVTWSVCGALAGSSGCYANGTIGSFGHVGAMLQGNPRVDAAHNTVTRKLYIVDQAVGGGSSTTVGLYVYDVTETINAPNVAVTVTKVKSLGMPLIGGAQAKTFIAGNAGAVIVGTDQTTDAEVIDKATYAISSAGGFSPPLDVSQVTVDHYGFASITYGGNTGDNAFIQLGPSGGGEGDGGGADFMLGTVQALSTADISTKVVPFAAKPRARHVTQHDIH